MLQAYRDSKNRIRLFRPDMNMERFARSSTRLHLPSFDKKELLECIKELLKIEKDWIPNERGYSLYIRPTHIGTRSLSSAGLNQAARFLRKYLTLIAQSFSGGGPERALAAVRAAEPSRSVLSGGFQAREAACR